MLFTSFSFLLFFAAVVFLYYLIPHKYRWVLLLTGSYFFYMSWEPAYAILIAISTLVSFYSAILMGKHKEHKIRRRYLWLSLLVNLGILFFFKYFNFFNESLHNIFQWVDISYNIPNLDILLPVGISFYTFQTLSYTLDVYYKTKKVEKHPGIFALYVSFFPQLIAGPIERSSRLLPQFYTPKKISAENFVNGSKHMIWGFFKKLVIADRIAPIVDSIYDSPNEFGSVALILAALLFAFQLYCDFSAYSDIAIGVARILGIDLMKNFNFPYLSKNITEFWRRWHISLSTWLRDYLYTPTVFSLKKWGKYAIYTSIFLTFVLCGLWHGPRWTYVVFGILQGLALMYESASTKFRNKLQQNIPKWFYNPTSIFITFAFTVFSLIYFRAENLHHSWEILSGIVRFNAETNILIHWIQDFGAGRFAISILFLIGFIVFDKYLSNITENDITKSIGSGEKIIFPLLLALTIIFGHFGEIAFIYFQF